jgi:glycosyltransferase involved in cell wall biosynthesis
MLSVVIPTYNRPAQLKECLNSLKEQTHECESEVVVVDDGSRDETRRVAESAGLPDLTYLRTEHGGPASARNQGVRQARGDVILLLDDDIIAGEHLLHEHTRFHKKYPKCVCLGYTRTDPRVEVTYLMRFLSHSGPQINPSLIKEDLSNLPFYYFMTANVSLPRKGLSDAGFFDSDFAEAGAEDIELGFRLREGGYRIAFNRKAEALHNHFMDDASFKEFWRKKGRALAQFSRKHPNVPEIERLFVAPTRMEAAATALLSTPFTIISPYLEAFKVELLLNRGYVMLWRRNLREGLKEGYRT